MAKETEETVPALLEPPSMNPEELATGPKASLLVTKVLANSKTEETLILLLSCLLTNNFLLEPLDTPPRSPLVKILQLPRNLNNLTLDPNSLLLSSPVLLLVNP